MHALLGRLKGKGGGKGQPLRDQGLEIGQQLAIRRCLDASGIREYLEVLHGFAVV
jgi:hypothetical protein